MHRLDTTETRINVKILPQQEAKGLKADRKSNLTAFQSSINLFDQKCGYGMS